MKRNGLRLTKTIAILLAISSLTSGYTRCRKNRTNIERLKEDMNYTMNIEYKYDIDIGFYIESDVSTATPTSTLSRPESEEKLKEIKGEDTDLSVYLDKIDYKENCYRSIVNDYKGQTYEDIGADLARRGFTEEEITYALNKAMGK